MLRSQLLDNLNTICSEDENSRNRGIKFFISTSITNPDVIISGLNEIKLFITSLSVTKNPRWGTISYILLALTNAIKNISENEITPTEICQLISISQIITYRYLHTTPDYYAYNPYMYSFSRALMDIFSTQSGHEKLLHPKVLLKICEHSEIGFISYASFLPLLLANINSIIQFLSTCDSSFYPKFTAPLESPKLEVVFYFTAVWIGAIKELSLRPSAIQTILDHSKTLADLASIQISPELLTLDIPTSLPDSKNTDPYAYFVLACQFLLLCCHSIDKQNLQKKISTFSELLLPALVDSIHRHQELLNKDLEQRMKEDTATKNETVFMIQRTTAEVALKKGRQIKFKQFELVLLDEAKILMWTTNKSLMKEGGAIPIKEIAEKQIVTSGKPNTIDIVTKSHNEYLISFRSAQEAGQWSSLIDKLL